ncbi:MULTISPECIES: 50S ribosomal protein L11 methyltransferase [Acidiphilium]|uniref:Ribosomal protein L11 methyltransferase n=1 Tax=Acidiphilium rubrum TaxID=526 RepID=A0A8G2FLR3_ACIRU|nr:MULTISPECIES: 50S ribosomal protein L11 methyltransferase [Acidiphilium]SIR50430.1 [LSU ribosomal protein L11P]-lysine N-methyltransferase [Acidiphilium rubrum]
MPQVEQLERIILTVPAVALEAFEAALGCCCRTVGFFLDEKTNTWVVEGLREIDGSDGDLVTALILAEAASGISPAIERIRVPAGGWLARSYQGFPEQKIGQRFAIRGTHIKTGKPAGRHVITVDAGLAFGTGEHGSTRGCLLALERTAKRRQPLRILDLGTGSGILGIAAAKTWGRRVLATDIDTRAVRVAATNAAINGAAPLFRARQADGWLSPTLRRHAPYDLVFANILARPLAAMAHQLAAKLAPGGTAILAGLLDRQANWVLSAHRRHGLVLKQRINDGEWTTLILEKPIRAGVRGF